MQKKYLIQGLPDSAKGPEVSAFFSLFGAVVDVQRCEDRSWLLEMKTNKGSRTVLLLNGEGYQATEGASKRFETQ